jgi:hypothetical protein
MPQAPNAKPGENPADIVDGTRKRKATECLILAKDLAAVESKKVRLTTGSSAGKKKPVSKKTTTTVVKSTVVLKESRKRS